MRLLNAVFVVPPLALSLALRAGAEPSTEFPCFELKDGTRVVGAVAQPSFQVQTAYGALTVPVGEVLQIRIGTRSDPDTAVRITALVKQLGDADFEKREKASTELSRFGALARPALEAALKGGDAEVQERAGHLIDALDGAEEEEPPIEDDEVVTTRFRIRGDLLCPVFEVATKYGPLRIDKKHIRRLTLRETTRTASVQVSGNREPDQAFDTGFRVRRGERLAIRASGSIQLGNWGQPSGPEGNPQCGQQVPDMHVGALAGRIGANGPLFKVGESYQGTADRDGTLYLCIAVPQNCGRRNTGQYKAEIKAGGP